MAVGATWSAMFMNTDSYTARPDLLGRAVSDSMGLHEVRVALSFVQRSSCHSGVVARVPR